MAFTGASGVLELARSQTYAKTISGFAKTGGTVLDLDDVGFVGSGEATFAGTSKGGVLTVTDGSRTARINLNGNYLSSMFVTASDGHGGTAVVAGKTKPVTPSPQIFIAAIAGLGSFASLSS